MSITTVDEFEKARAALTARPAAELADFILSLAFASDGIAAYVHAFLADDSKAAAEVLRSELKFLCSGERDSDYRHRKGAGHVARADRWLSAVERCVSPHDPQAALKLLSSFMESSERISEHCWDDDWGDSQLHDRVRIMVKDVVKNLPAEQANQALECLLGEPPASDTNLSR